MYLKVTLNLPHVSLNGTFSMESSMVQTAGRVSGKGAIAGRSAGKVPLFDVLANCYNQTTW